MTGLVAILVGKAVVLALGGAMQLAPGEVPGPGEPGGPIQPLTVAQQAMFDRGREVFDKDFHIADGLGTPEFNADSCRACHQDPVMGGAGGLELNVSRFASDNGGFGPFIDVPGGQAASKLRPPGHADRENYPPEADVFEQRQTPALFGAGLIDFIPDDVILAGEDPADDNGDGIRGVARRIEVNGQMEVGRFGWKAQIPRLADFVRDAMAGEVGITTPDDGRGFGLTADGDGAQDPELDPQHARTLLFFMLALGPPLRDGSIDPAVTRGEQVFMDIACDRCHTPTLQSSYGPAHLYSNLLLHDIMGPGFRGMAEEGAPSGMFRTPPLWGIEDTAPYLHDGRAETLLHAILLHQGEAALSSQGFLALPATSQADLIAFLEDL
jgi:CxxC motif-containing protein (DUF1111 family)